MNHNSTRLAYARKGAINKISSVVTQGGTVLIHQNTVGLMEPAPTTVLIAEILSLATKTMQPFKID